MPNSVAPPVTAQATTMSMPVTATPITLPASRSSVVTVASSTSASLLDFSSTVVVSSICATANTLIHSR